MRRSLRARPATSAVGERVAASTTRVVGVLAAPARLARERVEVGPGLAGDADRVEDHGEDQASAAEQRVVAAELEDAVEEDEHDAERSERRRRRRRR